MYFILSKVIYFLLTPIVWITISLIIAYFIKNKKKRTVILWSTAIFVYLACNPFLISNLSKAWEIEAISISSLQKKQTYGVVLGGFTDYDTKLDRIQFYGSSDRLWQTLYLYKQGYITKIIISGGDTKVFTNGITESESTKDYLCSIGFNADDIITENKSKNTYENAVFTKELLDSTKQCILITSALHMRRANACFTKQGIKTIPFCTNQTNAFKQFGFEYYLIPDIAYLEQLRVILREIFGYITYASLGYL